jgi:hypothetical protein
LIVTCGERVTLPLVVQPPDNDWVDQESVVLVVPFWVAVAAIVDGPQVAPRSGTVTETPLMLTELVLVGVMVQGVTVLTRAQAPSVPPVNVAPVTDAVAPLAEVAPLKVALQFSVVP